MRQPARATDLSGLPPAFIDVGSAETFRDEDVTYASRIWQAGGVAELHVWPGGFHGFEMMAPQAGVSLEAAAAQRSWLRRLHHSTLQDRIIHAERLLGWPVREPQGRIRLHLALVLRRLHHHPVAP